MNIGIAHGGAALVYAVGGLCAGLLLYMRLLNPMQSGRLKYVLGRAALFGLAGAGIATGLWAGWTGWAWIPALAIVLHMILEWGSLQKRKPYRGMPPVEILFASTPRHWWTTRSLRVLRYEIPGPWPDRSRLRIGHVSDLHINDATDRDYLHRLATQIEDARPDLILITGDFLGREGWNRTLDEFLANLRAPLGIFASLGNHDYAIGADGVRDRLAAKHIQVLHGTFRTIHDAPGPLALVGDDRPWGESRPKGGDGPSGMPWIGLSHSPDNAFDFARAGAFATFSGHLHAGQIRFPWLGPAALPSRNSRCFEHGHYRIGDMHLFVSAGTGNTFPPFRFRCWPDILLVDCLGGSGHPGPEENPRAIRPADVP